MLQKILGNNFHLSHKGRGRSDAAGGLLPFIRRMYESTRTRSSSRAILKDGAAIQSINYFSGLPRRASALLAMTSICWLSFTLLVLLLTESAFAVTHLKDTAPVPAFVFILHCIKYPYLIGLILAVQWPFFKWITGFSWMRALFPLLVTTFITGVICAVLIPFVAETFYLIQSSMYHRVSWTVNTFNPLGWFLSFLFFTTFVSFIELTVLYLCFRSRVRWSVRNFWFMYGATATAVGLILTHMIFD